MGIFDRLSTMIRSNINDLISRAENPEKMLNQLIVDMRSQLAKAKQQVAAAIADEKRLAGAGRAGEEERRGLGAAGRCWRCRRGATTWRSRRCCATTSTRRAQCSCTSTWAQAPRGDREAQAVAAPAQRQDRRGEAQEEHPHRAPEARRGAEADPGNDVLDRRQERVRDVRADGRADRARGAQAARRRRSE